MGRRHHKPEEIVAKLRQVEMLTGQGKTVTDAVRLSIGAASGPLVVVVLQQLATPSGVGTLRVLTDQHAECGRTSFTPVSTRD